MNDVEKNEREDSSHSPVDKDDEQGGNEVLCVLGVARSREYFFVCRSVLRVRVPIRTC